MGKLIEKSIVRTNMMEDKDYRPYCMNCPGLQRFGKQFNSDMQLVCSKCKSVTSFPKDFLERYKKKHKL